MPIRRSNCDDGLVSAGSPTQSALVILVPEAEFAVREWRAELDPAAAMGVPAHVTSLYPFASPNSIDGGVTGKLSATLSGVEAFDYSLESVRWFAQDVVWLAPVPARPFIEMTRALVRAFPEFPRYGGSFGDEVVPHLTIGDGAPHARMTEAARDVAAKLPITAMAHEVALIVGDDAPNSWHVERRFPLSPG